MAAASTEASGAMRLLTALEVSEQVHQPREQEEEKDPQQQQQQEQQQQQRQEQQRQQQQTQEVSMGHGEDMSGDGEGGDDGDAEATMHEVLRVDTAVMGGRMKNGEVSLQPGPLAAAVAAMADAYAKRATEALGVKMKEGEEEDGEGKQQTSMKGFQGKEQILLWNVKKGLAPIAAAAVDSYNNNEGDCALETPSSAAATGTAMKIAPSLEEETPRTSIPSLEVSPTNNFYSWKNCAALCLPSNNTALNSTSSSSTSSPSRVGVADDAEGSDGCSFLPAAVQSPAEILAAVAATAAAASHAASLADNTTGAASTTGSAEYPAEITTTAETASLDLSDDSAVGAAGRVIKPSVFGSDAAAAAAVAGASHTVATRSSPPPLPQQQQQLISTTTARRDAAAAAAVLSSPAALSLLATPCPIGGDADAASCSPLCSTGPEGAAVSCIQDAAETTNTSQSLSGSMSISLELTRTEDTAAAAPMNIEVAAAKEIDPVATTDNTTADNTTRIVRSGRIPLQEDIECTVAAALLQRCPAEDVRKITAAAAAWQEANKQENHQRRLLLERSSGDVNCSRSLVDVCADDFPSNEKEQWQASSAGGSDADLMMMMARKSGSLTADNQVVFSAEKDSTAAETAAAAVEKEGATVGEALVTANETGDQDVIMGGSLSSFMRGSGNGDSCDGSHLSLGELRSQQQVNAGAVGGEEEGVSPVQLLCQEEEEQQQVCPAAAEDVFKDVSAPVAQPPQSGVPCSTAGVSTSPLAAAFKDDRSPVSCCSSSSTASVASPTSSPFSGASCGGTLLPLSAAANTAHAAAAANGAAAAAADETRDTVADALTENSPAAASKGAGSRNVDEEENSNTNTMNTSAATLASSSSAADKQSNNVPTWYVGFRLPLGAEGRQVLLRRLRRAYHAAPPTTRDAVLASHGLYFSRVPFATVSDLFKLSHLLGVFDFAVQCSHEFGGSAAAASGGSSSNSSHSASAAAAAAVTGGGGASHGSSRKNSHHTKNANKSSNSNQRQLCSSGAGNTAEERKGPGGAGAEAMIESSTPANLAPLPQLGVAPAAGVAPAGARQRKNGAAGTSSKAGAAAASSASSGNYYGGGSRKAGANVKALEQMYSAETGVAPRGISKDRAAVAATAVGFEGTLEVSCSNARNGVVVGRGVGDAPTKTTRDGAELNDTFLKEAAAAAARCRTPQPKRSSSGRGSAGGAAAGRQQHSQQQQQRRLKNIQKLRAGIAVGCCHNGDRSNSNIRGGEAPEEDCQTLMLLQQLLQAGAADQHRSAADNRGTGGKHNISEDILTLLSGDVGKAVAAALLTLLPSGGRGGRNTKENQQQRQVVEQLLLLLLQEQAKTSVSSCCEERSKPNDSPVDSRETAQAEQEHGQQQQAPQRILAEALGGSAGARGSQEQQQVIAATAAAGGVGDNSSSSRAARKRSFRSADMLLQHEQRQWCSRISLGSAANEDNAWRKHLSDTSEKAQDAPLAAELLPLLTSAADQLRGNNCSVAPIEVAAAKPSSYRRSTNAEGRIIQAEASLNECGNSSGSSSSGSTVDWKGSLLESYLSSVREHQQPPQQQQQQRQSNVVRYSTSAEASAPAVTRTGIMHTAATCAGAVAAVRDDDHSQQTEVLQEEEIIRLTKRLRTTRFPVAAASLNVDASPPSVTTTTGSSAPAAAAAVSGGYETCGATRPPPTAGTRTASPPPPGKEDSSCSRSHAGEEEEALLSALMTTAGSSPPGEQQQRRWTLNTVEEITRLLLQLNNNSSSGTVTAEQEQNTHHRGDHPAQCRRSHVHSEGNFSDGGYKDSSSCSTNSSHLPCSSTVTNTSAYCSNSTSSNSTSSHGTCSNSISSNSTESNSTSSNSTSSNSTSSNSTSSNSAGNIPTSCSSSSSSIGKDGSNFSCTNGSGGGYCPPPLHSSSLNTDIRSRSTEGAIPSSLIGRTPVDASGTPSHHAAATAGSTYNSSSSSTTAFQPERQSTMPTQETQERGGILSLFRDSSICAVVEQLQQELSRRSGVGPSSPHGFSGSRSDCSSAAAVPTANGSYNKARRQQQASSASISTDSSSSSTSSSSTTTSTSSTSTSSSCSSSSNNSGDAHTDVFSQLTSQLQLLSAQVLQHQPVGLDSTQHHVRVATEQQQCDARLQTQQQVQYETLQKRVDGSPSSALTHTTAAAAEESVASTAATSGGGRLCTAEKATEYAASVQLLQLLELLQVQQRVSKLLSVLPKGQASSSGSHVPSNVSAPLAGAGPSPASTPAVAALPASAAAAAPAAAASATAAAFAAADAGNTAKNTPAAGIEPSASLLAALASTLLESKAGAAAMLMLNGKDAPAGSMLLGGLASASPDVMSASQQPSQQQVTDVYDRRRQQQQQRASASPRGPSSRGNNRSNNSRSSTTRNNNGNAARKGRTKNSQSGGQKFVLERTEPADGSTEAGAENGVARGKRERNAGDSSAPSLKRQETNVPSSSCVVAHSNSFSTCCSEDFSDQLYTSGSSSSGSGILKCSHSDSNHTMCDGVCRSSSTSFDRAYTRDNYSCNTNRTGEDVGVCLH